MEQNGILYTLVMEACGWSRGATTGVIGGHGILGIANDSISLRYNRLYNFGSSRRLDCGDDVIPGFRRGGTTISECLERDITIRIGLSYLQGKSFGGNDVQSSDLALGGRVAGVQNGCGLCRTIAQRNSDLRRSSLRFRCGTTERQRRYARSNQSGPNLTRVESLVCKAKLSGGAKGPFQRGQGITC